MGRAERSSPGQFQVSIKYLGKTLIKSWYMSKYLTKVRGVEKHFRKRKQQGDDPCDETTPIINEEMSVWPNWCECRRWDLSDLITMLNDAAAMENRTVVPQNIKIELPSDSAIPLPGIENRISERYLHTHVHQSIICASQEV